MEGHSPRLAVGTGRVRRAGSLALALALVGSARPCGQQPSAAQAPAPEAARAEVQRLLPALQAGDLSAGERLDFARHALDAHDLLSAAILSEARDALPSDAPLELAANLAVQCAYALRREQRTPEACALLRSAAGFLPRASLERYLAVVVLTEMEFEEGRFDQAFAWEREAKETLRLLERTATHPEIVQQRLTSLHQRLSTLGRLGQLELAPPLIEEMQALVPEVSDGTQRTWAAIAALHRLDGYSRTNCFTEELELARRVLADGSLEGLPAHRGLVELRLGIACWYTRDADTALASFRSVLANEHVAAVERGQAATRIAEILMERGNDEEARKHLERARALLGDPPRALDERLFFAAIESKVLGVDLGRLRAAFESFLDDLGKVPLPRGSGVGFLSSLRRREFLQQLMLAEMQAAPGEEGILSALQVLFRAQTHSTLVRTLVTPGGAVGSVREFRKLMVDDDSGLLVFFASRSSGLVFAVDAGRCVVAQTPSFIELNPLRQELVAWETLAPEARARTALPPAAGKLSAQLLPAEVRERVERWTEITVVGRDLLGPFSLELMPLAGGKLLGERCDVGYLPSLPLGILLQQRASRREDPRLDLALFLATELPAELPRDGTLGDIPYEPAHRERLQGGFPDERVTMLEGERVTPAALRGPAVEARCWLILAHGIHDDRSEKTPALLLSDADGSSGRLGSVEAAMTSAPRLVFLAACKAEAGPARPGDDSAAHLGGAFLAAGAEVVLLAPASIDYYEVLDLSRHFWPRLRAGESPARALRSARMALRAERGSSDPALALMHVVGLAHRPVY